MKQSTREAEKIYFVLFKTAIPDITQQRFNQASLLVNNACRQAEIDAYYDVVQRAKDLEAVEYAGRFFGPLSLLSKKFRLMVWLAGAQPELYTTFVNQKDHPVCGKLALVHAGLYSAYKLIKGGFWIWQWRRGHA